MSIAQTNTIAPKHEPLILSGSKSKRKFVGIWWSVFVHLFKTHKSPIRVYKILRSSVKMKKRYTKEKKYHDKVALVDGKVYFNCNNAGWPSKHFFKIVDIESRKALYNDVSNLENLRMVQLAFTKKCPLNCEHCYEGEELNKKDVLTVEDHKKIVKKLQDAGIPMIHFGGGDPMAKVDDVVEILNSAQDSSDFWVFTSGFNLNEKNAQRLKQAGLTGISIGLDHHDRDLHNKFRRNDKAYDWAIEGGKNAVNAGLVLTFTICLTREFCTKENLYAYLHLAKDVGASFVQMLEPRAVGNFAGKEVWLLPEHSEVVDDFFIKANRDPEYKDMPIVLYPGYHQKRNGCTAAGNKYLYIDTNGYMSSCPFCRNTKSHILDEEHEANIQQMKNDGCEMNKEIIVKEELVQMDEN
ncbi:radical SAM protein [Paracrocinitomix mangrovi]|uniref:radical SAM protein n=1 Tax=Paracrocinitomix mangrovi TaxID=2862509 RepID=UPI001C8CF48B|nr:radical SAM protein [Paracrocinitomix mangrovi]UKN00242.1 radical SAM protein [Paracrocinitomix mangrovi]